MSYNNEYESDYESPIEVHSSHDYTYVPEVSITSGMKYRSDYEDDVEPLVELYLSNYDDVGVLYLDNAKDLDMDESVKSVALIRENYTNSQIPDVVVMPDRIESIELIDHNIDDIFDLDGLQIEAKGLKRIYLPDIDVQRIIFHYNGIILIKLSDDKEYVTINVGSLDQLEELHIPRVAQIDNIDLLISLKKLVISYETFYNIFPLKIPIGFPSILESIEDLELDKVDDIGVILNYRANLLIKEFINLRKLKFTPIEGQDIGTFIHNPLLEEISMVTRSDISEIRVNRRDDEKIIDEFPNVRSLFIHYREKDPVIDDIVYRFPNLESIYLINCIIDADSILQSRPKEIILDNVLISDNVSQDTTKFTVDRLEYYSDDQDYNIGNLLRHIDEIKVLKIDTLNDFTIDYILNYESLKIDKLEISYIDHSSSYVDLFNLVNSVRINYIDLNYITEELLEAFPDEWTIDIIDITELDEDIMNKLRIPAIRRNKEVFNRIKNSINA